MKTKRNWSIIGAALATLLVSGGVLAQRELSIVARTVLGQSEVLITGQTQDTVPETRTIKVDTNGILLTSSSSSAPSGAASGTHGACTHSTVTVTGTATAVPNAPRTDRASLTICASTAGEVISCEFDGSAAVLATGMELGDLDCITFSLAGTVTSSCISDGTSVDTRVVECP